ncbi:BILE ACID-SODIUM SYMPORTER FAMILY PROTEIN [Klebsormidium nitens]|uniref:BILE ACID-SODIUM SYMPORTER FAMILY PROTEIN n=1 Tax=Klebsormidium nitens TaxID=105231 RepID=A0A1Y1IRB7_KLENI|nr:BILE ACID-SODIUM SYMPORTER FAMILY PROTEIN [Klebsormidium nitens]|eukprot:GAQ91177.1 BILE ACID-SODIUM SYMPORTER FAMILY PROTEIN [Klebsormidium nitens]
MVVVAAQRAGAAGLQLVQVQQASSARQWRNDVPVSSGCINVTRPSSHVCNKGSRCCNYKLEERRLLSTPQHSQRWAQFRKGICSRKGQRTRPTRAQAASFESSDTSEQGAASQSSSFARISSVLTNAFPVWVALSCALALYRPTLFTWIQGQLTIWALGLTMLGMGTTLSFDDFKLALRIPKSFLAGVALQYTVMPALGYLIAHFLGLPHHFAVGIILVACCPGGTASNIVTFLAQGNVALSVLMTAASTFLAVVMTPLLTAWLAGTLVAVDAWGLFSSTLQVVLLPVLLGAALNRAFPLATAAIGHVAPLFAVFTVAAICGSAIGANAAAIWASGASLALAVFLLHSGGFCLGYTLAKLLGLDESSARTISIEVGMQNSVLGVVLATQNFPNPLTAAPCAVSSVCHSVIASVLAGVWRMADRRKHGDTAAAAGT